VNEIQKQVAKLITDGIVEPSVSEYNMPLLLVPKKPFPGSEQKKWRNVVKLKKNYCPVNFHSQELMIFWINWDEQNIFHALT